MNLTEKQKILLFLISCNPGVKSIYKMIKVYDNASFPFKVTENLQSLLDENLILISSYFNNKNANEYEITEKGEEFLHYNFNEDEIIRFIKTMDNPDQLLMITQAYIDKKNGS